MSFRVLQKHNFTYLEKGNETVSYSFKETIKTLEYFFPFFFSEEKSETSCLSIFFFQLVATK